MSDKAYTAATITPTAEAMAKGASTLKAPSSTMNSPTKLPRPGMPREATTKNRAMAPMRGARIHRPPI